MDNFSERLRKARAHANMGQVELAAKIKVSKGTIGNWETNPPKYLPDQLKEISTVLGVSLSYLRGESEKMIEEVGDAQRLYGRLKLSTLQSNVVDLAENLKVAPPHERKFIISNLREMLDEIEQRELVGTSNAERERTTETRAKMILANDTLANPPAGAESGSLQTTPSSSGKAAEPNDQSPPNPNQKRTPPKPALK